MVSRKSRTGYQEDSVCFVIRLRLALFLTSGYRVSVSRKVLNNFTFPVPERFAFCFSD